ncbi:MAG: MerC domain-containing protein [Balneolaceae bacterium]|nr:MAG: MerC domain-containing protein [Balneolaceae bacterium]
MLSQNLHIDKIGAGLSLLCLVHCMATAFMVGLLPLFAMIGDFHTWLLVPLIPVAGIAIYDAVCVHKRIMIALFILGGIILISIACLVFHGSAYELPGMITGSVLLVTGHYLNHRSCRHCKVPTP